MTAGGTVTCPAGHASTTTDYCDTCGAPIGAKAAAPAGDPVPPPSPAPPAGPEGSEGSESAPAASESLCPSCGEPVMARFCESCGFDVEAGVPAAAAPLTLVLGADKAHWDRMVGSGEPAYPTEPPTLTFLLDGDRAVLGRIRSGAPVDVDLALSGAAGDPAVSHHQCEFVREAGSWTVRDAGSSNGTWVNDAEAPLAAGATHVLVPGDRLFIGAWTCLTVQAAPAGATPAPAPAADIHPRPRPAARRPDPGALGRPPRRGGPRGRSHRVLRPRRRRRRRDDHRRGLRHRRRRVRGR